MEGLVALGIALLPLAVIAIVIWYFYIRAKETMKNLFGTDDLKQLIETRDEQEQNTPKSVAGMTSLYVPRIQKDFPELNWVELRGMAEKHLLEELAKEGKQQVRIHKTVIFNYIKQSGTCVIVFQSGIEHMQNSRKIQTRYNTHMMYIQDADKYGQGTGFSVNCPHCGGELTMLGAKFCQYCGSEVIPINIHVWRFHKIEECGAKF